MEALASADNSVVAALRVGFVGLGNQGGPIAARIIEHGFPVTVWARRSHAVTPYVAGGAIAAPNLAAVGAGCDVLCICVLDDMATREVVEACLPAMRTGSAILVMSTVHPETCCELAAIAYARGIDFLDAPVSGGGVAASEGRLTVIVGGEADVLLRCRPVIASFASAVFHIGPVGAGQTAKLVNNCLMAANLCLAHEAIEAGVALGLDRVALNGVIAASSGRSFAHDVYATLPTLSAFAKGASLLEKDSGLLDSLARKAGVSVAKLFDNAQSFIALAK